MSSSNRATRLELSIDKLNTRANHELSIIGGCRGSPTTQCDGCGARRSDHTASQTKNSAHTSTLSCPNRKKSGENSTWRLDYRLLSFRVLPAFHKARLVCLIAAPKPRNNPAFQFGRNLFSEEFFMGVYQRKWLNG